MENSSILFAKQHFPRHFPQAFMTVRVPAIQRMRETDVKLLLELPEALKRRTQN